MVVLYVTLPLAGILLGWLIRWLYAGFQLSSVEQKTERLKKDAVKEAEVKKSELVLQAQNQLLKERKQQELELRDRRQELQNFEKRLLQREDVLDKKSTIFEDQKSKLNELEGKITRREEIITKKENILTAELERVSGLTTEEAKKNIMAIVENEARRDAQVVVNKIDQEAQAQAEKMAREVLVSTIQRVATEVSSDVTITTVNLPNDEMKGRIIGREGRNIRALETLTGVDVIIDDTPEAVVISCFEPVRREIARQALDRLITDGRIHPTRIEEVVQKINRSVKQAITEEGEKALFELSVHNMNIEGVRALGRLFYRTSYGQNVLNHSCEVAILAGTIASEVGAEVETAKRSALLHDIGKGIEADGSRNHAEMGADLARRLGEDKKVVNAILAHHNDVEPESIEAVIVQIADAISAARPGARREALDSYIKRLENLEKIAQSFSGVGKAYAIQAGRELRIMVNHETIDDKQARQTAKDIAKKIEDELQYPGRIKVTIIRETRVTEYAR